MLNSSVVNRTYGLLPGRYQERFDEVNPFSGFAQFFSGEQIGRAEDEAIATILQLNTIKRDPNNRKNVDIYQMALDLMLENAPSINDDLGTQKLPKYNEESPEKRTAGLIDGLGEYFVRNDYGAVNYQQLHVLIECIAYVKRFYRKRWRVEVEDVLEAWYIINYCKQPQPPLRPNLRKILGYVKAQNREGKFPTQRQIIRSTSLASKTVSQALGLKIKSAAGAGILLAEGYVAYNDAQGGYHLTELGELALDADFHITIGTETYQPKNPLES